MRKTIKAKLSITRPHTGGKEDHINITIHDAASGIEFVDLKISLADFATSLTGQARMECEAEVDKLEYVGKNKETISAKQILPKESYDAILAGVPYAQHKKVLGEWLEKYADKPGWIVNPNLNHQNSIVHSGEDQVILNFSHYRFVEA